MRNIMTRRMARSWLPCNARQGLRVHAGFIELRFALGQPTDGIRHNAGQVAVLDLDRAEGSQCRDCAAFGLIGLQDCSKMKKPLSNW